MNTIPIAVDAMGGENSLPLIITAVLDELHADPDLHIVLVGDQSAIDRQLAEKTLASVKRRLAVQHAADVIHMSDKPASVLRAKTDSSIHKSITLLQQGEVKAVVSTGNTGALMVISRFILKMMPGIDRPAICSPIPTVSGHCYWLDLGANVVCSAQQLYQFAIMGSAMATALDANSSPKVALLNVGEEEIKGNDQVKLAAELISQDDTLNFVGNVEGDRVFNGGVDVVVCDGFVGNVAVKVCEGTATLVARTVDRVLAEGLRGWLVSWLAKPLLQKLYRKVDPDNYDGGCLLGLRGIVIKSHGDTSVISIRRAIHQARQAVKQDLLQRIETQLAPLATAKAS